MDIAEDFPEDFWLRTLGNCILSDVIQDLD